MSVTNIPWAVKLTLLAKSGCRCEFPGCNEPLWIDSLTQSTFNKSYIAHIVADSPNGPRGDKELSRKLSKNLDNLMLLCGIHHRLIDGPDGEKEFPAERLRKYKIEHEDRVVRATGIDADRSTHVVLYGANIGDHTSPLTKGFSFCAVLGNERYPAEDTPIEMGLKNSAKKDDDEDYWRLESENLQELYNRKLRDRLQNGEIKHLSIFGMAPQPLLALFGHLLSDIPGADLYQLHRRPPNWEWREHTASTEYLVHREKKGADYIVLALSLSQKIVKEKITEVLGEEIDIWTISIDEPNNEFLKNPNQLDDFRIEYKKFQSTIKNEYSGTRTVHVFSAAPIPIAIEIGRSRMKKVDWPVVVYDYNSKRGGFVRGIEIE